MADSYIIDVQKAGKSASEIFEEIFSQTCKQLSFIDTVESGKGGLKLLTLDEGQKAVVFSLGGDPKAISTEEHAASLVDRLVHQAEKWNATPLAMANVVDAQKITDDLAWKVGKAMGDRALHHGVGIMNGETAGLGSRVLSEANISGTMVALLNSNSRLRTTSVLPGYHEVRKVVFQSDGARIALFSDGTGTKLEFYERLMRYTLGLQDSLAMKLDDCLKRGATAIVVSDVLETNSTKIPLRMMESEAIRLSRSTGFKYILQPEKMIGRIRGYTDEAATYNLSGTVVCSIDEERLKNPMIPSPGDVVIAIKAKGPRSNGITPQREAMVRKFGHRYRGKQGARQLLEHLSTPSIVFYGALKELVDEGKITGFYHMSGGAYEEKLAEPLAKHGLYVEFNKDDGHRLFEPSWQELSLVGMTETSPRDSYGKFPMGNEGFAMAKEEKAKNVIAHLKKKGLDAQVASIVEKKQKATGVMIHTPAGNSFYFNGKAA